MPSDPTSRTLLILAGAAVLAWCVWLVRDVLPPFVLALALALLLDPLRARLQRRGLPRWLAVGSLFALFLAGFIAVVALLVPRVLTQLGELLGHLDEYGRRFQEAADDWARRHAALLRALNLPPTVGEVWQRYQGDIARWGEGMLQRLFAAFQVSAGFLGWLVIVPLVTLYLMFDLERLRTRMEYLIAERHRHAAVELAGRVSGVFAAYLRGLSAVCVLYALCVYLALALLFRVPYSLVLALLAAVLYAVPYLGQLSLLAASVGVAWAAGVEMGRLVGIGVVLLLVGQAFDQVITPRVIGKQVGLHPVLGLFALMVGGQLFGLAGMVLAVPVAASLRVVLIQLFPRLAAPLPAAGEPPAAPAPCDAPAIEGCVNGPVE